MTIKKILTSWLRNTTIVFTLNMESWFMLIGRCHGNDEWRMDFFRRLIQRLSWIMVSSFAQLKARNEKERKTAKCWQLWLNIQTLEQMFSAKQAYILPYVHLPRLTRPVNLHQLFLFWKHGSVRDPEKNQVQTLGCKNQGEKKQGHSKRVDEAWPFSFWITTTLFFAPCFLQPILSWTGFFWSFRS